MNTANGRASARARAAPPGTTERPERAGAGLRRPWLALYAALLALGAWAGAAGLAAGFLALPATLEKRLPLESPLLGGAALVLLVAVPASVLAVMAWRGHRWVLAAAVLDGVLLIGWIMVEVAFLREFGFLHAVYLAVGVGLVMWGGTAIPELISLATGPWRDPSRAGSRER